MAKLKLTKQEMETIIRYDDFDNTCIIYTCNAALMNKMDKYCELYPDVYNLTKSDEESKTYGTDKSRITFRSGIKRAVSEEQRQASKERLAKYRNDKTLG